MRLFKAAVHRRKGLYPSVTSQPQISKSSCIISVKEGGEEEEEDLEEPFPFIYGTDSDSSLPDSGRSARSTMRRGIHYPRRPTLKEILADEASPPWTLEAFTTYCARALCLENLEFLQEAERYKNTFNRYLDRLPPSVGVSDGAPELWLSRSQKERLREIWVKLMVEFIVPSSPRELNIPGEIRAGLASQHKTSEVPSPKQLRPAVQKIYELIEESILFSFLNDVQSPSSTTSDRIDSDTEMDHADRSLGPAHYEPSAITFSPAVKTSRSSNFHLSGIPRSTSHVSNKTTHSSNGGTNSASASIAPTLTDDSGSMNSPSGTHDSLSTPPGTPPRSDFEYNRRHSPKQSQRDATWKRMSVRFGRRKRSASSPNRDRRSER